MLTWIRVDGYWMGNGFRIEHDASGHWILIEPKPDDDDTIQADPAPMATLPTLSACKYAAEEAHRRSALKEARKRLGAVAVGSASLATLAASNPLITVGLGIIATAATLELAVTWFTDRVGGAREITQ